MTKDASKGVHFLDKVAFVLFLDDEHTDRQINMYGATLVQNHK